MGLKVAIQMDHVSAIDITGDSTFVMGLEAENRGHQLYHYTPPNLAMLDGRIIAEMQPLTLRREAGNHFTLGDATAVDLVDMDVVLLRQDGRDVRQHQVHREQVREVPQPSTTRR